MPERPDPPDASSEDDAEDVGSSERERDEGASAPLGLRGADTGDAESLIRDESRIDAGGEDPLGPRSGLDDFLVEPAVGGAGRGSPAGSDAPATPSRTASGSGRPDLDALMDALYGAPAGDIYALTCFTDVGKFTGRLRGGKAQ